MVVGPATLATASGFPPLHLKGDYHHSGDPAHGPLYCGQAGHSGLCHRCDQELPFYVASDLETAVLLAAADVATDERPLVVLRRMVHIEVDLSALDFANPLALAACGLSRERITGEDPKRMWQLADIARERDDIAAVLCPCPPHIPTPEPAAVVLAIFPSSLMSPFVEIIDDYLVKVDISFGAELETAS